MTLLRPLAAMLLCGLMLPGTLSAESVRETSPETTATQSSTTDPAGGEQAAGWAELERIAAAQPRDAASYRARFEQKKFSPLLRDPIVSRGVVQMANGVARWDTEPPHATTVVMSGDTLQIYYPDQQTLEVYELGANIGGAGLTAIATSPVPDLRVLREHFDLDTWGFVQDAQDNPRLALTLVPRSDSMREALEDVYVTVDPATGHLASFRITDLDGEATELTFINPETDVAIDPASLAFTAPPGTTVVRPLEAAAP